MIDLYQLAQAWLDLGEARGTYLYIVERNPDISLNKVWQKHVQPYESVVYTLQERAIKEGIYCDGDKWFPTSKEWGYRWWCADRGSYTLRGT